MAKKKKTAQITCRVCNGLITVKNHTRLGKVFTGNIWKGECEECGWKYSGLVTESPYQKEMRKAGE